MVPWEMSAAERRAALRTLAEAVTDARVVRAGRCPWCGDYRVSGDEARGRTPAQVAARRRAGIWSRPGKEHAADCPVTLGRRVLFELESGTRFPAEAETEE